MGGRAVRARRLLAGPGVAWHSRGAACCCCGARLLTTQHPSTLAGLPTPATPEEVVAEAGVQVRAGTEGSAQPIVKRWAGTRHPTHVPPPLLCLALPDSLHAFRRVPPHVQATAGRLVVAGMEAAQEALGDLEPGTPTVRRGSASEAGGQGGLAGPAAASAEGAAAEEEVGPGGPAPFESPRAAWADIALLAGITAAGRGSGFALDLLQY